MEYWTPYSETHPREHKANALLITNDVPTKRTLGLIRLTSFPNTSFSTCLVMSSLVQLVSNFVSTPFALKKQLRIPPPPLLVTCVRLMMMFRMKDMLLLHAPSDGFSLQEVRIFILLFYIRITINLHLSIMDLFYFMNRRAVTPLD